jgi:TPR repeat protein
MARYEASFSEIVEAADLGGAPDALFELGLMYCTGREVMLDLVQAHKWFNLAALRGNEDARRYRTELSREMTRVEIGMAQKAAREWLSCH